MLIYSENKDTVNYIILKQTMNMDIHYASHIINNTHIET